MRTLEEINGENPDKFEYEGEVPENLQEACFGMGCFWGVEAMFGALDGVWRTIVGYTGGEKEDPTYKSLGKHTETVAVYFDPEEISHSELLKIFFENHDYTMSNKAQYASRIFVSEDQREEAERALSEHSGASTEVQDLEIFWVAEDYHQKYRLRQFQDLMAMFSDHSPEEFINSPLAAKLNGAVAGNDVDLDSLKLENEQMEVVRKTVTWS